MRKIEVKCRKVKRKKKSLFRVCLFNQKILRENEWLESLIEILLVTNNFPPKSWRKLRKSTVITNTTFSTKQTQEEEMTSFSSR